MKIKNKIILCVCSFILMICTIFSFAPISKSDNLVVKADTIITSSTFSSSNVLVPIGYTRFDYSNGTFTRVDPPTILSYVDSNRFSYLFGFFSVDIRNNPDNGTLEFRPIIHHNQLYELTDNSVVSDSGVVIPQSFNYINRFNLRSGSLNSSTYSYRNVGGFLRMELFGETLKESGYVSSLLFTDLYSYNSFDSTTGVSGLGYISDYSHSGYLCGLRFRAEYTSLDFNVSDIVSCTLSMKNSVVNGVFDPSVASIFYITYVDGNGYSIRFSLYCGSYDFDYIPKTYYYVDDLNSSQEYNQGYQAGQQSGYNNGFEVGRSEGYNAGYNVGQDVGYNNGFSDGVEDSNQYTFLNLISATIDAPITYFQELFNFELLGVNLQGFLTGLFTLCVIVTIIKLCLGG